MEEENLSRVDTKRKLKEEEEKKLLLQKKEQLRKLDPNVNYQTSNNNPNNLSSQKHNSNENFNNQNSKPKKNGKKIFWTIIFFIIGYLVLWFILLMFNFGSAVSNNKDFDPKNIGSQSAVTLVLGVDGLSENDLKNDQAKAQLDDRRGVRADSIMLLATNPSKSNIKTTSVYRDLLITDACTGESGRLNATFANGWLNNKSDDIKEKIASGASCMKKSLENYFGFEINNYLVINFSGFEQIINAAGGVDIDVIGGRPKGTKFCEQDKFSTNGNPDEGSWDVGKYCFVVGETRHLNGEEALAYSRHRHSDNDQWRTMRQSQVMAAIIKSMKSPFNIGLLPFKTFGINSAFTTNINSSDTVMYLLRHITNLGSMQMEHIELPFVNNIINGTYYLNIPRENKNQVTQQFKEYLEN